MTEFSIKCKLLEAYKGLGIVSPCMQASQETVLMVAAREGSVGMVRKGLGKSSHVIRGTTVICHHASHQQSKSCRRPILHSLLAMKMGQAPTESYTERMKFTQATSHDSKGLPSDKCGFLSPRKIDHTVTFK